MMQRERIGLKRATLGVALALGIGAAAPLLAADSGSASGRGGDTGGSGMDAGIERSAPAGHAPFDQGNPHPHPGLVLPSQAAPAGSGLRAAASLVLDPARYPLARRDGTSDRPFGVAVADPYRWLEGDLRSDPAVADWVGRQSALTRDYLAALPGREAFAGRLRTLYDFARTSLPRKAGNRYFFLRNSGLMNQFALYVRDGLGGVDRLLVDPNAAPAADRYALDAWAPSQGGRWIAVSEQRGGSDWRTIRVIDAQDGHRLDDRLDWANDTLIGWVGDTGFFYSRYPAPQPGQEYSAALHDKAVWFHRVGSAQADDVMIHATPDHPEWGHKAQVTSDGRWAVLIADAGTGAARVVNLIDLTTGGPGTWQVQPLAPAMTHDWRLVDGMGDRLWFITDDGAPAGRLVRIDLHGLRNGRPPVTRVVLGGGAAQLEAGRIVGDRLIVSALQDGHRLALVTDLDGRPARAITIEGNGAASGFDGRPGDAETFYQYSSYNQPPTIYRLDMRSGQASVFDRPHLPFDPADYVVEDVRYPSRDGTMVPMTIVRKRALADKGAPAPTLLYGYGGFDIALTPAYSPLRMAWLEAGGVFAIAAVRGGGELGPAWHDAGRLARKQNSFDDFIAAGEWLLQHGITPPGGLAAQGSSNGGMMVAAAINQRPDLFAAANPDVGVMDMLRFDRFTQGRSWTDDYGDPRREADWRVLRAYSPYHNIRDGAAYPAILVTTADTDDRVVPAHSFKYVAALQAAQTGDRPHLLRVESGAGHGNGKPLDKQIAGGADVLAFLAAWTGLNPPQQ